MTRTETMAKNLWWKAPAVLLGTIGVAAAAFLAGRSWAAGIPADEDALNYSGTLTNPAGELVSGDHNIQVNFWRDPLEGTTPLCQTPSIEVTLIAGRFSVPLPENCVDAVREDANTFVEVLVDGSSLGRSRIGAVPYALEAGHALEATIAASAESASGELAERTNLKTLVTVNTAAFLDERLTSTNTDIPLKTWVDVPQRTVTFTKRFADSRVRVTYQDTLGTLASSYAACVWRVLVDTTSIAQFSAGDHQGTWGWAMDNGTHTAWGPPSLARGNHTVKVQVQINLVTAGGQTECLSGWNSAGGFLAVEEIP